MKELVEKKYSKLCCAEEKELAKRVNRQLSKRIMSIKLSEEEEGEFQVCKRRGKLRIESRYIIVKIFF